MKPERQIKRISSPSPIRSPSPLRSSVGNRSPAPFSSRKITSINVESRSRPETPTDRRQIEVITPDVQYYEPARYTPDLPNRMMIQAPTNYADFVNTTPRPNGSFSNLLHSDVKVTKIVRKHRNSSASPSAERKLSTGSQTSQRSGSRNGSRRAPQERQPIMVASIANFDQPRSFKSVKPPKQRAGTQTDFESGLDSDYEVPHGEISISIQTDAPPSKLQAVRKRSADKIVVDVAEGSLVTRDTDMPACRETDISRDGIAESPQLFIPPTPPLPETPPPTQHDDEAPPPPTPLRERKAMESKADQMIESHSDLLLKFPPPPEKLMKKTPETIRKSYTPTYQEVKMKMTNKPPHSREPPPRVPRKEGISLENMKKMKLNAHKNATEVHRRMSPMHDMTSPHPTANMTGNENSANNGKSAIRRNHVELHLQNPKIKTSSNQASSVSSCCEMLVTDTEPELASRKGSETEMESVKVLDDDVESLAIVSVYDTDIEREVRDHPRKNSRGSVAKLSRNNSVESLRSRKKSESDPIQQTHDLCQITVGESNNTEELHDKMVELGRAGRMSENEKYLKEKRLYRVLHEKHYDGIGPTDDEDNLPLALRSTVDKPKDWYKSMFKAMNKAGRSGYVGDINTDGEEVFSLKDESPMRPGLSPDVIRQTQNQPKKRYDPGNISDWTPGPAYVSENEPAPRKSFEDADPVSLRERRTSARGEAAKESVAEMVSKPWQNYFDDIEGPNVPITLLEGNTKHINKGNTPQPVSKTAYVQPNHTPGAALQPVVTPAPKTVGAYLQTSTRQLIPDKPSDAEIYAPGSQGNYQEKRQTAKVLFTFKARSIREMTVYKGEQVVVLKEVSEKWVDCESKGRTGIVPKSYLEYTDNAFRVIQYGKATAKYDFKKKSNRQLSFNQDDELTLIKRVDKNWYEARINNTTKGLVPVSYLSVSIEPITTHDNSNFEMESLSPAPSVTSRPTSMTSHHSNEDAQARLSQSDEVFRKISTSAQDELNAAVDELSNLSIKVNEELDETLKEQVNLNDERPPWVPQQSERFQAIYSFKPQHDDELELGEGDVVYVFEKCLDGWYIGAHGSTGAIGTFPGNYTIAV